MPRRGDPYVYCDVDDHDSDGGWNNPDPTVFRRGSLFYSHRILKGFQNWEHLTPPISRREHNPLSASLAHEGNAIRAPVE
jgi:hypothetical protein